MEGIYRSGCRKSPPLPRRAYGDLEKEGGLLTFIPEIVKVIENGKEVALDNLKAIGNLVNKPKKGFETGYKINEFYWPEAIEEKRKLEKPHWVWIKKEAATSITQPSTVSVL